MRSLLPASFAMALFVSFGCTKILGIDKDYVEASGTSSTGSGAGTTGSGGSGQTSSTGGTGGTLSDIPCDKVADCPGADNECSHRVCVTNLCGVAFTAAGTAIGAQTTGDCKKVTCDGHGLPEQIADDTDLPDDSNPCTLDTCKDGVVGKTLAPVGTLCGNGLMCDMNGSCAGCTTPADCPGVDNECQTRACTSTICDFIRQPAGTQVSTQIPGDCKLNVCTSTGQISVIADGTDPEDDGNPCTVDGCSNGSPTHVNTAAGAPCTKGNVCNGAGSCVECVDATSCSGQDDECKTRKCTSGTCGFEFKAVNTMVALQSPGDCKRNVCDGSGNVMAAADDTDVPNDGNPCTADTCSGGVPTFPPANNGQMCGANKTCNASGQCIGCTSPGDCPGTDNACQTRTCNSGVCGVTYAAPNTAVGSQVLGDCKQVVCDGMGQIVTVPDNTDPGDDFDPCTSDVCSNGTLTHPPAPSGTSCGLQQVCNGAGLCGDCAPGDIDPLCCSFNTGACCSGSQAKPGPQTEGEGPMQSADEAPDSECCCHGTRSCDSSGQWGECF